MMSTKDKEMRKQRDNNSSNELNKGLPISQSLSLTANTSGQKSLPSYDSPASLKDSGSLHSTKQVNLLRSKSSGKEMSQKKETSPFLQSQISSASRFTDNSSVSDISTISTRNQVQECSDLIF